MTDPKTEAQPDASEDAAPDYGPVEITVRFWLDAEPETTFIGLSPWLAAQTLYRAADNLLADESEEDDEREEEE